MFCLLRWGSSDFFHNHCVKIDQLDYLSYDFYWGLDHEYFGRNAHCGINSIIKLKKKLPWVAQFRISCQSLMIMKMSIFKTWFKVGGLETIHDSISSHVSTQEYGKEGVWRAFASQKGPFRAEVQEQLYELLSSDSIFLLLAGTSENERLFGKSLF